MAEETSRETIIGEAFKKADELKKQGMPIFAVRAQVQSTLMDQGIDPQTASNIANCIPDGREVHSDLDSSGSGLGMMVFGGLLCVGGILITVITRSVESSLGYYVVAYGPIIAGAVLFIKGYFDYTD